MKAAVFVGPGQVLVRDDLEPPTLLEERDAIVRVTRAGICGSDLHPYRGEMPDFERGTVLGHEFTGVVVEAGPEAGVVPGDRVVASDVVACGRCPSCAQGRHYHCVDVTLFGYSTVVGRSLPGGQAELVRVPYADVVLRHCPEGLDDEEALFVGDVLTTGLSAAKLAAIAPGAAVAVVGGGAVGILAAQCAVALGAGPVVVVDVNPHRLRAIEKLGLIAVDPAGAPFALQQSAGHPCAPSVIEAVGHPDAFRLGVELAAPTGTVVVVGAHHADALVPAGLCFVRELTIRFVVGDPITTGGEAMALVTAGRVAPVSVISHRLPLDDASEGYRLLDSGSATKVVLLP